MPSTQSIKTERFDCPKCKQVVTFRYIAIQHSTDEGNIDREIMDRITDYGKCQVAREARVPNHPVIDEWSNCPYLSSHVSK